MLTDDKLKTDNLDFLNSTGELHKNSTVDRPSLQTFIKNEINEEDVADPLALNSSDEVRYLELF